MEFLEHCPLAPRTTFAVGGLARFYTEVSSVEELGGALAFARTRSIPSVILGGGSNILVDDGEAEALFVRTRMRGISHEGTQLIAHAGDIWDDVVAYAVEQELWGLENLSGIPGSLGGAVVQNIGAYGAAFSETCSFVEVFDYTTGHVVRFDAPACSFGYRTSVFKEQHDRFCILRAGFTLRTAGVPVVGYRDIAEYFGSIEPTHRKVRDAVLHIRAGKFPDLSVEGTAGSFFKNPIVSIEEGERLQNRYQNLPLFPLPESSGYKVPLAWILDHVLNLRGFSTGPVRCFETQPLVIVASRGAHARNVRAHAFEIQQRIYTETQLMIEPEVCVMRGASFTKKLDF